jgi:hypothetical protein
VKALRRQLGTYPAIEPSGKRTEYQSALGREWNVGGHAHKDAEHYPDSRADGQKDPRSPSLFPGFDTHVD